jgi:PAS domain S-box-containing protein
MAKKPTYMELEQKIKVLEKEKLNRMAAEKAFQQSEEKYRLLVNNLPSVVYKGYPDWSVEFFDSKIEKITGYSADKFNSKELKWKDVVLHEDLEPARETFITALKAEKSYVREYRIESKQGSIQQTGPGETSEK